MAKVNDTKVSAEDFKAEKTKLENDRATLNDRLQAINVEREKCIQQLTMIAGAIQALNQLIERTEPEKVEIDTDSEK